MKKSVIFLVKKICWQVILNIWIFSKICVMRKYTHCFTFILLSIKIMFRFSNLTLMHIPSWINHAFLISNWMFFPHWKQISFYFHEIIFHKLSPKWLFSNIIHVHISIFVLFWEDIETLKFSIFHNHLHMTGHLAKPIQCLKNILYKII